MNALLLAEPVLRGVRRVGVVAPVKSFGCKTGEHRYCWGLILIATTWQGVQGTKPCSCPCHKRKEQVK